jgi:hypothetical protein
MNDYYPFLLNETAKLDNGTSEDRRELYERIQKDLVANLRRPALRLPEAEINVEQRAFGVAVQRIEAELNIQSSKAEVADSTAARLTSDLAKVIPLTRVESNFLQAIKTGADAVVPVETAGVGPTLSESVSNRARMLAAIGTPRALALADHYDQLADNHDNVVNLQTNIQRRPGRRHVIVLIQTIAIFGLVLIALYVAPEIKTWLGFE